MDGSGFLPGVPPLNLALAFYQLSGVNSRYLLTLQSLSEAAGGGPYYYFSSKISQNI